MERGRGEIERILMFGNLGLDLQRTLMVDC